MDERHYPELTVATDSKIVFLIMDGLGGFRSHERGSELMESRHPNLNQLAREASCGLLDPVAPGVTPGSGPGHLGLFGYDPEIHELGRGALSAAGLGVELKPGDVAARGNFATIGETGNIVDRRAGRPATEYVAELCQRITARVSIDADFELVPEKEHRALLVLRGHDLSPAVSDTDPQQVGVPPLRPEATALGAERTAALVADFDRQTRSVLEDEKANLVLLRGFDTQREMPSFVDRYKLRALALASYPMYIGISRILGMETLPQHTGLEHQLESLAEHWTGHDFFYFHVKGTDSAGEDGDFARKCSAIEEVDELVVPRILELEPDVVVVTGDHSTPTQMAAHSWHPVPALLWARGGEVDGVERFDEDTCRGGSLGRIRSKQLMPQVLSAARRLVKYGA